MALPFTVLFTLASETGYTKRIILYPRKKGATQVSWFANRALNRMSTVPAGTNAHPFPWRDQGPPLKVLMPHAAGLYSYEVRTFADVAKATAYLDNRLRGHIEPGIVAFWALGWEPEELRSGKAEPVVLINDATRKGVAFSFSFVDLDSAMAFLREEYARGLDLACVEVYWAAPLLIKLQEGRFHLSPDAPPARPRAFAELKASLDGEFGGPRPTGWAYKTALQDTPGAATEPAATPEPTVEAEQTYNQPAEEVTGAQYYADLLSDIERHLDLAAERSDAGAAQEVTQDVSPAYDAPSDLPESDDEDFAGEIPLDDMDLSFLDDAGGTAIDDGWPAVADEPTTEVSEPGRDELRVNELINDIEDLLAQEPPNARRDNGATETPADDTPGDYFFGFGSRRSNKDGGDSALDDAIDDLVRGMRRDQPNSTLKRPDPLSREGVERPVITESGTPREKQPKGKAEHKKNDRNVPLLFRRNGVEERFMSLGDEAAPQATIAQPEAPAPVIEVEPQAQVQLPEAQEDTEVREPDFGFSQPEPRAPSPRPSMQDAPLSQPEARLELPEASPEEPRPDPLSRQGVARPISIEPAADVASEQSNPDTTDTPAAHYADADEPDSEAPSAQPPFRWTDFLEQTSQPESETQVQLPEAQEHAEAGEPEFGFSQAEPETPFRWAHTLDRAGLPEPEARVDLPEAAPEEPRLDPLSQQGAANPVSFEPVTDAIAAPAPSEQDRLGAPEGDYNEINSERSTLERMWEPRVAEPPHAAEQTANPQATLPERSVDEIVNDFAVYVAQIKEELDKFRKTSRFEKRDDDFDGFDSPPGRF